MQGISILHENIVGQRESSVRSGKFSGCHLFCLIQQQIIEALVVVGKRDRIHVHKSFEDILRISAQRVLQAKKAIAI